MTDHELNKLLADVNEGGKTMQITDEQLVRWKAGLDNGDYDPDDYYETMVELQEARAKIINLEASLTIKDYLIAELEMKTQALQYAKGGKP